MDGLDLLFMLLEIVFTLLFDRDVVESGYSRKFGTRVSSRTTFQPTRRRQTP